MDAPTDTALVEEITAQGIPKPRPWLSELQRRRWEVFKANRRGFWSLWIFLVLFVASLVGLPVGLALVALYFVALLAGLVTTAYCLGALEAHLLKREAAGPTRGQQALMLLAGVLTLAVLRALPIVGGLVVFVSVLFGLGALALWSYQGLRGGSTAQPARA